MRVPSLTQVLAFVEREQPDVDPRRDARAGRPLRARGREDARAAAGRLVPHRARPVRAAPDARPAGRRGVRPLRRVVLPPVRARARPDGGGCRRARAEGDDDERLGPRRRHRPVHARRAATRRSARGCSATATCCCSSSGACRPRSGSRCCSRRSRGSTPRCPARVSCSPATGRAAPASRRRRRPARRSSASCTATSSRRSTRAPTRSASRARPTRSGR